MSYHALRKKIDAHAIQCGRNPEEIRLVAVSKTHSVEAIQSAYFEGARLFGESRIEECMDKIPLLSNDIEWHFIGTLQRKKVAKTVPFVQLIHSVDSFALAEKIAEVSLQKNLKTSILLQVNTSGESTKHGLSPDQWEEELVKLNRLTTLQVKGLMTMAPLTTDQKMIRECFAKLKQCKDQWKKQLNNPSDFYELSMGMSHDYLIAIEEGATLLRIGSAIFKSKEIKC